MPPAAPQNHDPALAHSIPVITSTSSAPAATLPNAMNQPDLANVQIPGLDQNQLMSLLRNLPGVFKLHDPQGGTLKEDAAQTLSNLAQAPFPQHPLGIHAYPGQHSGGLPGINDPGPSSHPRGPPNLGQLSAVALQAAPAVVASRAPGQLPPGASQDDLGGSDGAGASSPPGEKSAPNSTSGRSRGRNPAIGSDEWSRQRKDNHKEVERRRRGNINEGINELGRIVPSGSGEKAKGAILSRAVQYIHHLKDNEARNIEKWTLEKLLMDQAMGDLQAQLEDVKRLWEEERACRQRAEGELELLRKMNIGTSAAAAGPLPAVAPKQPAAVAPASASAEIATEVTSGENLNKRRSEGEPVDGERNDKKAKTE